MTAALTLSFSAAACTVGGNDSKGGGGTGDADDKPIIIPGQDDDKTNPKPDDGNKPDPDDGKGEQKPDPDPPAAEGAVKITEGAGDLEAAYVKWSALDGASWYNVYHKGETGDWIKLDAPLIRQYKTYFRADAVGLKAGKYQLKVVPRDASGKELADKSAIKNVVVAAHEREGYAFVGKNGQRVIPGTYNEDGTLKEGVRVLYITDKNKDSIELDVITNKNGSTTACKGIQDIFNSYAKGLDTRPVCVRFIGNITTLSNSNKGDLQVGNTTGKVTGGNVTFEGIGNDATINGFGICLKKATMMEVRNLGFMNCASNEGDNVSLQQEDDHIWVHNNDMFYGGAGSDADQAKGDGALDTKKSSYVTHSYNHFWDSGKCNLQGMKDAVEADALVTYHHNWYDHSDSRHPRIRAATVHIYNNYYDGVAKYGVGATTGASAFVENNYFRSTATLKPMLIAGQATDVVETSKGTFSGEDGGMIKAYGNRFDCPKVVLITQNDTTDKTKIDCYLASSRDEIVPAEYKTAKGGNVYNNFDTAASFYSYTPDTPEVARDKVKKYAGRVGGGDVEFVFDNAVEDSNSSVIPALKKLLVGYTTELVKTGED